MPISNTYNHLHLQGEESAISSVSIEDEVIDFTKGLDGLRLSSSYTLTFKGLSIEGTESEYRDYSPLSVTNITIK